MAKKPQTSPKLSEVETVNPDTGEVSNLPAVATSLADAVQSIGGKTFKIAKQVTVPQLKIQDGPTYAVKFISNIYDGKDLSKTRKGTTEIQKRARLVRITNLNDNRNYEMIVNEVLEGILSETYGDPSYKIDPKGNDRAPALLDGRMVMFRRSPVEGKRYKAFEVVEIEAA